MSMLDGQDLFASGPHATTVDGPVRQLQRRSVPGLDGERVLDAGRRSRTLRQSGRLQASDAATLRTRMDAVEAFLDGRTHTLTDEHGAAYPRVLVEQVEWTTPVQLGRGAWCEYRITYRQLP